MPPILLAVFHCSLYREHISSWGGGGLISIPAPPRGATGEVMHNIIVFEISIHAPPRGATSHGMPCLTSKSISIHAPPRGATRRCDERLEAHPISIHAPPRGATSRMIFIGSLPLYFNSRPSARGDPVNVERKSFTPSHFNSRPSARGDVRVLVAAIIGAISIHAPPRGATLVFCSSFAFCPFQFTPLREGRPQKETSQRAVIISIHAPPRGATRPRACRAVRRTISIHAPPRGATFLLSVVRPSSTISIHAPPRGAT